MGIFSLIRKIESLFVLNRTNRQGIWLITIPKSGSMYMLHTLSEYLALPEFSIKKFPEVVTDPNLAKKVGKGAAICHAHTIANGNNIATLLAKGIKKCIVHVRDPRQCVLSWVYWLNEGHRQGIDRNLNNPALPSGYYSLPLEEQIDWQIETRIPHIIEMVGSWFKVYESEEAPIEVLFTRFADLKADGEMLFSQILNFYEIEVKSVIAPQKKEIEQQPDKYHYRKGELDEWRRIFSPFQQQKSWELMPARMCEKFEWKK